MKLNKRSCVLDSFAYILGVEPKELDRRVGHYGTEGYHTQELIEICLRDGWSVTAIERHPVAMNPETYVNRAIRFSEGNERRFARWLAEGTGILLGLTPLTLKTHAVAWNGLVYDPGIDLYYELLTESGTISDLRFTPQTFLKMDQL